MPEDIRRVACVCWPPLDAERQEQMLCALEGCSPCVEEARSTAEGGYTYLDAHGLAAGNGEEGWCRSIARALEELGVAARLGLASCPFAAYVAAQTAPHPPGYQIVRGADAAFLAPLSVAWLPLSDEARRRLQLLGLRRMGQLAALSRNALSAQFGPESLRAHAWAKGRDMRPLSGRGWRALEARCELERETRREALISAALRLCERALQELPGPPQTWSLRRIALGALSEEGQEWRRSVWLDETPAPQALRLKVARLLEGLGGESLGLRELWVRLEGVEPAKGRQLELFAAHDTRQRLAQTAQRLGQKHAGGCLLRVETGERRLPLAAERYALRPCAP